MATRWASLPAPARADAKTRLPLPKVPLALGLFAQGSVAQAGQSQPTSHPLRLRTISQSDHADGKSVLSSTLEVGGNSGNQRAAGP